MSYLFRDQRVINELERPKSSDFNIAQSLQTRNLAAAVQGIYSNGGVWQAGPNALRGFDGPRSMQVVKPSTSARAVTISAGMALGYSLPVENVGNIAGVSSYGTARMAVLSQQRTLTVPAGPADASECRVDVIAIKPLGYLAEYASTDIFSPSTQSFGPPVTKPKAYRWDLYDVTLQELSFDGIASATSPLIYVKGAVSSYSDADSFLSAPVPSLPADYIAVAAINIRGGSMHFTLPEDCVRDLRYILSPGGNRNQLFLRAACGSKTNAAEQAGYVASYSSGNGGYTTPRFIVANANPTLTTYQYFQVIIFTNAASTFTARVTGTQTAPTDLDQETVQQAQVIFFGSFKGTVDSAFKALLESTDFTPSNPGIADTIAVGQPYIRALFAVAKTEASTLNGAITLTGKAINFGKYDLSTFVLQMPLLLTVDWYPFSYD